MVNVDIKATKDGFIAKFDGHADSNDICAAISILSCTLASACANVENVVVDFDEQSGDTIITVSNVKSRKKKEVETILFAVYTGLILLQNKYPKNIFVVFDDF